MSHDTVALKLETLLPKRPDSTFAADGDDVVAAVGRGVVYRFVLAHQNQCNLRSDATQRPRISGKVDEVPGAGVGEAGLYHNVNWGRLRAVMDLMYLAHILRHGQMRSERER